MSSYLTTLAARALDQPQPIRPRLPSLFEPGPSPRVNFREVSINQPSRREVNKSSRSDQSDAVSPESHHRASELRSSNEARAPKEVIEKISARSQPIKSFSQSVESSPPPAKRLDEDGAHLLEPGPTETRAKRADEPERVEAKVWSALEPIKPTVQVAQTITIEQTNFVDRAADLSGQPQAAASSSVETQTVSPQAIVVKPEVTTNVPEPIPGEPQMLAPEPQTSVKITIGRIDVRAVMPPPPAMAAVARQPVMKPLSLDEYLQRRNGEHG